MLDFFLAVAGVALFALFLTLTVLIPPRSRRTDTDESSKERGGAVLALLVEMVVVAVWTSVIFSVFPEGGWRWAVAVLWWVTGAVSVGIIAGAHRALEGGRWPPLWLVVGAYIAGPIACAYWISGVARGELSR